MNLLPPLLDSACLPVHISRNVATYFVMAKEWTEREQTVEEIMTELNKVFAREITSGTVLAFGPPPIPGLGTGAGFTMMIQDKAGNTPEYLQEQTNAFVAAAQKTS